MSSDHAEVNVSLKAGVGYDAPWITFKGPGVLVNEAIAEAFGFETAEDWGTLAELVVRANATLAGLQNVAKQLGGTQVSGSAARPSQGNVAPAGGTVNGDNPEQAAGSEALEAIAACDDVAKLRTEVYPEYLAEYNAHETVRAAFAARAKELEAA